MRSVETDLSEIACEGENRPQVEGLIAVRRETSSFCSDSDIFYNG